MIVGGATTRDHPSKARELRPIPEDVLFFRPLKRKK
jgi:hypothetical protein